MLLIKSHNISPTKKIGEQTGKVVKDLSFCSSKPIRLARKFVSSFIYEPDATFNTNELQMPLSILVGILNTGKTFPFGLCFITLETTASFEFMEQQLDDLFFYNCPRCRVICGDFAKGLASAIVKREAQHYADGNPQKYILQLCEWNEVEAIKRHVVAAGRYPKDIRDKIVDLIWKWVKSPSQSELEINRSELLQSLLSKEQEYLLLCYEPKEHQFVRAYWHLIISKFGRQLYSAQLVFYHHVIKSLVNRQMPLAESVRRNKDHIK